MNKIKLILWSLAMILFIGCGGSSSDVVVTETTVDLRGEFKGQSFYAIKNDVLSRNLFKVVFDENLTNWDIELYDNNYSTESISSGSGEIIVTNNKLTDASGSLELVSKEANYINLVSTLNPLVTLKLFSNMTLAQEYYDISLQDELKSKEFFVVQNNSVGRSLYKINFTDDLTQWDVLTYDGNYTNQTSTNYGLSILVNDSNLTDSGETVYRLNSKESDYLNLVATSNSTLTLKFYESETKALEYYNSLDLRDELKDNTFYTVSDNGTTKSLIKLVLTEDISQWSFSVYDNNYTQEPTSTGTAAILVKEDRLIEDGGDTLKLESKQNDYLNLISLSNTAISYRLYTSVQLAQEYYDSTATDK